MLRRTVLLCCLLFPSIAVSQTATVSRNVYLRSDPSTAHPAIRKLLPPAQIQLLETAPTNGFYHVKAETESGWVWGRNIRIQARLSGSSLLIESSPVDNIPQDWGKGTPQNSVFAGEEGSCATSGDGGDSATNLLKNRVDVPSAYHSVTWNAINNTSYPEGAKRSRADWTPSQLDAIAPFEGVPVALEGFLYKVKVESSSPNGNGGETTNCHAHLAADVDWHMPLTASSGQGENLAVIVETTPRLRQAHPNWTVARLKPWTENVSSHANAAFNGQPIRIFGWLMLDPEHQDMITEGLRSTLWEIHPITRIEVFQNGQWTDLDSLP